MRVCHVCSGHTADDGRVFHRACKSLAQAGYDVHLVAVTSSPKRPITVSLGTSELVGNEPRRIREAWERVRAGKWKQAATIPLWDGRTAERIVGELRRSWG